MYSVTPEVREGSSTASPKGKRTEPSSAFEEPSCADSLSSASGDKVGVTVGDAVSVGVHVAVGVLAGVGEGVGVCVAVGVAIGGSVWSERGVVCAPFTRTQLLDFALLSE